MFPVVFGWWYWHHQPWAQGRAAMRELICLTNNPLQELRCWDHLCWTRRLYGGDDMSWLLKEEKNEPERHRGKGDRILHGQNIEQRPRGTNWHFLPPLFASQHRRNCASPQGSMPPLSSPPRMPWNHFSTLAFSFPVNKIRRLE